MEISYPIAFFSGLLSFFAPCVLPLLPVYIAYVVGVSLSDIKENGLKNYRLKIIKTSLAYVLGFSLLFTLLGTTAGGVGIYFRRYSHEVQIIGGTLMLIFGLDFAGILKLGILKKEIKFELPKYFDDFEMLRAFILGLIFAATWTPCIGAILGTIYALAAVSGSAVFGASLLFVYSLGISIPFFLVSLTLIQAPKYIKFITKYIERISFVSGLLLAFLGLSLITGYYAELNAFLFDIAYRLGYEIR